MGLNRFFTKAVTPIVADFGAGSVKLLQLSSGETPAIIAAHEIELPEDVRNNVDRRFAFIADTLPDVLKQGGFKGRRIVCSPSSSHFTVQQVDTQIDGPISTSDQIRGEVANRLGCASASVVVRSFQMPSTRSGRSEHMCLAIARDDVMRHVDVFKRCRMDLVGVHSDHTAMMYGFEHLHRRTEDDSVVTMYVDAGWGAVKVAIGKGTDLVFARIVQVGGRHMDQVGAELWKIGAKDARQRRIEEEHAVEAKPAEVTVDETSAVLRAGIAKAHNAEASARQEEAATGLMLDRRSKPTALPGGSVSPSKSTSGFHEVYDTIADELSLCVRYASAAVGSSTIHRLVFLGGESRSRMLSAHLARTIGVKACVGDPLQRYLAATPEGAGAIDPSCEHPEWAVACGLCAAPVEA